MAGPGSDGKSGLFGIHFGTACLLVPQVIDHSAVGKSGGEALVGVFVDTAVGADPCQHLDLFFISDAGIRQEAEEEGGGIEEDADEEAQDRKEDFEGRF